MALGTKWLLIEPSELRACLYCILFYCRKELEESGEELIRIKECYVQLSEESRSLEEKLKEQFEKEKQVLLSEASLHMYIGKYRSQSIQIHIENALCCKLFILQLGTNTNVFTRFLKYYLIQIQ